MKSIHSENELKEVIGIVLGRDMDTDETGNFITALEWINDERRGYRIISTYSDALFWLKSGDYYIANFVGGIGISRKQGGGCQGYFDDGLIEKMVDDSIIIYSKVTGFCGIGKKGYELLAT